MPFFTFIWPYQFLYDWRSDHFPRTALLALFVAVWLAATPFSYLLLTDTLRQARVRTAHLWRGLAYGLPALSATLLVPVAFNLVWYADVNLGFMLPDTYTWLFIATLLWTACFWYFFTSRYLRLSHAAITAAAMLTVSGLFAAIVTATSFLLHTR